MDLDFEAMYRDGKPPWEIGAVQPALAAVLDQGAANGPRVLDVGCGTGDLALELAGRGFQVTAVDFSPTAVERARAKAAAVERARAKAAAGLSSVTFEVQDATVLDLDGQFDSIFDSGLLHSIARNGGAVDAYLARLPELAAPGATLFVLAMDRSQGWGVTEEFLLAAFPEPQWAGSGVERVSIAARAGDEDLSLPGLLLRTTRRG